MVIKCRRESRAAERVRVLSVGRDRRERIGSGSGLDLKYYYDDQPVQKPVLECDSQETLFFTRLMYRFSYSEIVDFVERLMSELLANVYRV
ncbi:unnamed protein product, partial [Iphiclides podalirius]